MTTAGRRPVPTALKVLRGNPGKRALNAHEPKPRVAIPPCPAHLSREAKREWRRAGRMLAQAGLLTSIDRAALALYAQAWARWVEAERALQQYGLMVRSQGGLPVQSPYLAIANRAMEQLRHLLAEFGMSPASRSRVHAVEDRDDALESVWDELDALG